MKWAFTIRQKMKAAIILGIVFLLVFAKNWLDERNVSELGNSFSSVFEDRLLAESYIYKLSDHLYQKKIMMDNCSNQENLGNLQKQIGAHNLAINAIIRDYEKTKLTTDETSCFREFKSNVEAIEMLESNYLNSLHENSGSKLLIDERYAVTVKNLHQLSSIQVAEGKLLNDKSKKIVAGSSILTQFELALLIGVGLIIQALIFAARSAVPRKSQPFSLN